MRKRPSCRSTREEGTGCAVALRRWRYWIAAPAAVAVALLIDRWGAPRAPQPSDPLAARTAALDTKALMAVHELLQTVVPPDENLPPVALDEDLMAAPPLGDLVGARPPSAVPGDGDLSDTELEGIGGLIGGLG